LNAVADLKFKLDLRRGSNSSIAIPILRNEAAPSSM
jgi:hypothetical protein